MLHRIGSYVGRHHIGLLALFIALSGTAYAAVAKNSVGPKQLKTNAVTGIDANEATFGPVPSAQTAQTANTANTANSASTAARADNGAQAYAAIDDTGVIYGTIPSFGLTQANVTRLGPGSYCFHDLPFTPRHIQVTGMALTSAENASDNFFTGSLLVLPSACTLAGNDDPGAVVTSFDDNPDAAVDVQDARFFVVFY